MSSLRTRRRRPAPLADVKIQVVDRNPLMIMLGGGGLANVCQASTRRELINRLFALRELRSLQLNCKKARLRLEFSSSVSSVSDELATIAEVMRQRAAKRLSLLHDKVLLGGESPPEVEIRRWGSGLTFWRVDNPSARIFYLRHPLLRFESVRRAAMEELATYSDAIQRVIAFRKALMLIVRPFRIEAEMFPEILDPVLTRSLATEETSFSPRVQDALVDANLALAPIADFLFPPAGLANAALTGALTQKSVPLAWSQLRSGKLTVHSLNVLIAGLSIFAFEFLPAALMSWLTRFWSKRTRLLCEQHQTRFLARYRHRPHRVWLEESGVSLEVSLETLSPSSVITLRTGDVIPGDGVVVEGAAGVNENLITGRAEVSRKSVGSSVFAATRVAQGTMRMRVHSTGSQTAAAQLARKLRGVFLEQSSGANTLSRIKADEAVLPNILAAVVASFTGGLTGFRSALRPDFLTGPAISEQMAGLSTVIYAANHGVILGERSSLALLPAADYYLFDETVDWQEEREGRDAFRRATKNAGDSVFFTSLSGQEAADRAARLGFQAFHPASTREDKLDFLQQGKSRGKTIVYIGHPHSDGQLATQAALHVSVIAPPFNDLSAAPVALLSPDLGKFALLLDLAREVQRDSETALRIAWLPNIAAILGAILLRSPVMASVLLSNVGMFGNYVRSAAVLQLAAGGHRRF